MNRQQYLKILEEIVQIAESYSVEAGFPVDLKLVRKKIGLSARFSNDIKERALLVRKKDRREEILINRNLGIEPSKRGFIRYIIAHEIGHMVLLRSGIEHHFINSEYWAHEYLCDSFAGKLLIPDEQFSIIYNKSDNSAIQRLSQTKRLALSARVNWATAAYRISCFDPATVFLEIKSDITNLGINFKHVNFSSIIRWKSNERLASMERKRIIKNDSKMNKVLQKITTARFQSVEFEPIIEYFPSIDNCITAAVSYSKLHRYWRLAVCLDLNSVQQSSIYYEQT
ncbi:ImmA/IrrE family metallo-endopeptidase [bacterium]|nr:ImmA/IrrE family metallo-endopeptidase [bacterium]